MRGRNAVVACRPCWIDCVGRKSVGVNVHASHNGGKASASSHEVSSGLTREASVGFAAGEKLAGGSALRRPSLPACLPALRPPQPLNNNIVKYKQSIPFIIQICVYTFMYVCVLICTYIYLYIPSTYIARNSAGFFGWGWGWGFCFSFFLLLLLFTTGSSLISEISPETRRTVYPDSIVPLSLQDLTLLHLEKGDDCFLMFQRPGPSPHPILCRLT